MSEVVRAGLRLLENDEDPRKRKLAELDAALARGIADAEPAASSPPSSLRRIARYQAMADRRDK